MPGRTARFTQAELARIVRAVRQAGGGTITVDPMAGTFTIQVRDVPETTVASAWRGKPEREIIL